MVIGISMLMATSCSFLEDYLDKAPESGMQEKEVFSKYANFRLFFDAVYDGRRYYSGSWRDTWNYKSCTPFYIDEWDQKYCFNSTTDMCDMGRYMEGHAWKSGNMSETIISKLCYDGARRPTLGACYDGIRITNMSIRNIDQVQDFQDATVMNDFLGQAYFMRGFFHWTLFRYWGPMPYMDVLLTLEDSPWDYERMGKNEYLDRIVQDWDSAYYYFNLAGKLRRDPVGSLAYGTYEMHRPNGMAAKSFKARALLYAASPLNNKNGVTDWQEAAAAAWDAIQIAEANGVDILPLTEAAGNDRHLNYFGAPVCLESIWTRSHGDQNWNFTATWWGGHFMSSGSASGVFPTQNWVDRYETKWGDPLVTQADRDAATALGHYKEQQPYKDRDPRFYKDIIYNGSPAQGWGGGSEGASNTAYFYYTGTTPTTLMNSAYTGTCYTGYAFRKFWNNNSTKNQIRTTWADPLSRLSELYLEYAEAVNEAYGPAGTAPGCPMNAWDAIDVIRLKSGMPVINRATYSTAELLRPRIKNERCIELAFEGQFYYDDVRRWMDLPQVMGSKLMAAILQKTTVSPTYPDGYIYTRAELPPDRQPAWEEGMYYLYFLNADGLKMSKFKNNPAW